MQTIFSIINQGLGSIVVAVEVVATRGQPSFILIGLADRAMAEAKERITAAFYAVGLRIPAKRVVVNLAPADIHKKYSHLELAVAVSLLAMLGLVKRSLQKVVFIGELSLDGQIKPVKKVLAIVLAAQQQGFTEIIIPTANQIEVGGVTDITIRCAAHLREVVEFVGGKELPLLAEKTFVAYSALSQSNQFHSWSQIAGQWLAKRATIIAAAGGHNLLLLGPPGSGKTLLAKALGELLPPLDQDEVWEIAQLYSLKGLATNWQSLKRPFRNPHHTVSAVGLLGGGNELLPGELSLAHRGVLFLDEFPEFNRSSLEALRQPLESGWVHLIKGAGQVSYPADFCLVAAANPCPCGFAGVDDRVCNCSPHQINQYQQKLSGPIMDRIDLQVRVEPVKISELSEPSSASTSLVNLAKAKQQIIKARNLQKQRYGELTITTNAHLNSQMIAQYCPLTSTAKNWLKLAATKLYLSARSYFKVWAVAQTICDLRQGVQIEEADVKEAIGYRLEK